MTPDEFVERFETTRPQERLAIVDAAIGEGVSERRADVLIRRAVVKGLAFEHRKGRKVSYANEPPLPEEEVVEEVSPTKWAAVEAAIKENPVTSNRELAERFDATIQYVRKVRKDVESD
jgi:hypothetical protein